MGVDDSICWGVDIGVGAGVDIDYGIKYGLDNESRLGYFGYYFDGLNYGKHVGSFI